MTRNSTSWVKSVKCLFLSSYVKVQHIVILTYVILSAPLQGWLTVGSTPFRPNPDGVTVDGLTLSQFTWEMDLTPPRRRGVWVCVTVCVWESEIWPWKECTELREEPACRAAWREEGDAGGRRGEKRFIEQELASPRGQFTKLPALNTPTAACLCVCVCDCVIPQD